MTTRGKDKSATDASAGRLKTEASTNAAAKEPSASSSASTSPAVAVASAAAVAKAKFCLNCQKDLTRNIRITCAECVAPGSAAPLIELCVECFGVGTEMGGHKKTHRYTVSDCLAFPLVRERGDEALTSTATTNAAAAAATTTTAAPSAPAPAAPPATPSKDTTTPSNLTSTTTNPSVWTADEELLLLEGIEMFGMGNWKDIAEHVVTKNEKKCEAHYLNAYLNRRDLLPRFLDEPEADDTAVAPSAATTAATTTTTDVEMADASTATTIPLVKETPPSTTTTAPATLPERPSGSELAGYMPLRGDFDVEYENEAELILADMEFSEDDHPTERELKLKVIEIYNAKLDERERRKKFVIERGLLDYKKHQQLERRRPKDEREIIAQMRPFARFQTPQEHEDFVNGLITAMRLRKQILLLQEYRKNGVRTLAEAELYDVEKKKRETEQALQKQRESASYLYESGRPSSGGRDRASRWMNRGSESATGDGGDESSRTRGGGATGSASLTSSIDGAPGSHLLTPKEKELCVKLKLLPKHYLVIKDALVRECYRLGYLSEKKAQEIVKIDVNKTGQIYDFFVHCGWVRNESSMTKITVPSAATATATKAPPSASSSTTATLPTAPSSTSTPAKRKADEITPDVATA